MLMIKLVIAKTYQN